MGFTRSERQEVNAIKDVVYGNKKLKFVNLEATSNIVLTDIGNGQYTITETEIDGVTLALDGKSYALTGQTDQAENGIYVIQGILPTTIGRAADYTSYNNINKTIISIREGTRVGNFLEAETTEPFTLNTTPIIITDLDNFNEDLQQAINNLEQSVQNTLSNQPNSFTNDFTNKPTPVGADTLLIDDSEDSGNKKNITIDSLSTTIAESEAVETLVGKKISEAGTGNGGGGGASQLYFTDNASGSIPTYNEITQSPDIGAEIGISAVVNNSTALIKTFVAVDNINDTKIDAGQWNFLLHASTLPSSGTVKDSLIVEVFIRNNLGVETFVFSEESGDINTSETVDLALTHTQQEDIVTNLDDKIVVKISAKTTRTTNTTITLYTGGSSNASRFEYPKKIDASEINFNNTGTILTSETVQNALVELSNSSVKFSDIEGQYELEFNATTDWTLDGDTYKIDIPQTTHLINGLELKIVMEELVGVNEYEPVIAKYKQNDITGDVTIRVSAVEDARFEGRVFIYLPASFKNVIAPVF